MLVTISGNKEEKLKSSISTSSTKTSPAMGALNTPDTAPAAPHPTSNIKVLGCKWNRLPKSEPHAAPVSTIGASAPTEPPKPMVMALAMMLDQRLCDLIRLRPLDIA